MKTYLQIALVVLGLSAGKTFAQVGMTNNIPDKSAALDLKATNNKGVLIPNVNLSTTATVTTIAGGAPVTSLLVYNTNTGITGTGAAGTGYYFWDGTASLWKKLITANDVSVPGDNLGNHRATTTLHMANNIVDSISTANVYYQASIYDRTAANTNYVSLYKNNGVFGIWTNTKGDAINITETNNNVGIGTNSPSNKLTVNAAADPLKLTGLTASSNSADNTLLIGADGVVRTGAPIPSLAFSDVGTVIAVNGQLVVAQEITAYMSADFDVLPGTAVAIGNLINKVVDNQNKYVCSSTSNSFTVSVNGTYQIMMNVCLSLPSCTNSFPAVGVWCDTDNGWVAKAASQYYANTLTSVGSRYEQIYTLITAINMTAGKTYSFRAGVPASCSTGTVLSFNPGSTGAGPITYCSIRRLK